MRKRIETSVFLIGLLALAGCEKPADGGASKQQGANAAVARTAAWVNPDLDPEQIRRGRQVFEANCQECHGPGGKGQGGDWRERRPNGMFPPPPLDDSAHAWHHPTAILKRSIRNGSPPGWGDMPAWEGKLTEAQIDDVVVYIKSLWSPEVYRHWTEIEKRSLEN